MNRGSDVPGRIAGQLRWRCRRGMKELDVLLNRYVDAYYEHAAAVEQAAFRELLELQDPLIYDYFVGRLAPPDPVLARLVARIVAAPP